MPLDLHLHEGAYGRHFQFHLPPPLRHVRLGSRQLGEPSTLLGRRLPLLSVKGTEAAPALGSPRRASPRQHLEGHSPRLPLFSGSSSEKDYVPLDEDPWWVKFLARKFPLCQAVFTPADFATRRARAKAEEQRERMQAAEKRRAKEESSPSKNGSPKSQRSQATVGNGLVAGFRFGLPDFETLEFGLVPPAEAKFKDGTVYRRLGLHLAIHKRKSTERLCLRVEKSRLPRGGADQVMDMARRLLQCDHPNILRCLEVAEDDTHLYFLHEHMPCVTLEWALRKCQHQVWTEAQKANLAREVTTALCQAQDLCGLNHLGLTLRHVLLPATESNDPAYAKVFGFGLLGAVLDDSGDRSLWPPEGHRLRLAAMQTRDEEWLGRLPGHFRVLWDSWSLGGLIYAIVDGRLPFHETQAFEAERLRFSVAFDTVQRSAQALVEGLLCRAPASRLAFVTAGHHDWLRFFSRKCIYQSARAFDSLDAFCSTSLAQRLFGCFLVEFLDARAERQIAQAFHSMDFDADGLLGLHDLEMAARHAGIQEPKDTAEYILETFGCQGSALSLSRFAASLAEETIDSRSLRLAFESIDKDGSQQITPSELLQVLRAFDTSLTLDQVVDHIGDVEAKVAGTTSSDEQDHVLDFDEFAQLFPQRVAMLEMLERRTRASRARADDLGGRFEGVRHDAEAWMRSLEGVASELGELKQVAVEHFHGDQVRYEAIDGIQNMIHLANQRLHSIPGPLDFLEEKKRRLKAKSSPRGKAAKQFLAYGFDTFMQDHAIEFQWPDLVKEEDFYVTKTKKKKEFHALVETDYLMVYDCAEAVLSKIGEVLNWSRSQAGEYEAFSEAFAGAEGAMPRMAMSGRGLQSSEGGVDDGGEPGGVGAAEAKEHSSLARAWPMRCFC